MQLSTKTLLLAVLAGTSSAGRLIPREELGTAAIIGTFTDSNCQTGQTDLSDTVKENWGTCRNLPGSSMKIWWTAKGCTGKSIPHFYPSFLAIMICQGIECSWIILLVVLTFTNRQCTTSPHQNVNQLNTCIKTSNDLAWWVYCI